MHSLPHYTGFPSGFQRGQDLSHLRAFAPALSTVEMFFSRFLVWRFPCWRQVSSSDAPSEGPSQILPGTSLFGALAAVPNCLAYSHLSSSDGHCY